MVEAKTRRFAGVRPAAAVRVNRRIDGERVRA
jgi:hypothetical protein